MKRFRTKDGHFCTYLGERDVSFSANCNILIAVLEAPDMFRYSTEINNILEYLCESWWRGAIRDKWVSGDIYCKL